jgi:phospholipase C
MRQTPIQIKEGQRVVQCFIEDDWRLGRIGGGSFDRLAGGLGDAFAFRRPSNRPLRLNPITGEPLGS